MRLFILGMWYNMSTYSRNSTVQVPDMLTLEEMKEEVHLDNMLMDFYLVFSGNNSFVPKKISEYKKFITIKSG
jgi:hypothetical protein